MLAAGSTAPGQPQKMWLSGLKDVQFSDGGQLVAGAWVDLVLDWATAAITLWRRNEGQWLHAGGLHDAASVDGTRSGLTGAGTSMAAPMCSGSDRPRVGRASPPSNKPPSGRTRGRDGC